MNFSDVFESLCQKKGLNPNEVIAYAIDFFVQFSKGDQPTVFDLTSSDAVPTLTAVNSAGKKRQVTRSTLYPDVAAVTRM
jgi:hypothetical protein